MGIRVPEELTVDLGRPLFVERCLAMFAGDLPDDDVAVAARLRLVRADGLARFAAAEAAVFDTTVQLAARWVRPVLGAAGPARRRLMAEVSTRLARRPAAARRAAALTARGDPSIIDDGR